MVPNPFDQMSISHSSIELSQSTELPEYFLSCYTEKNCKALYDFINATPLGNSLHYLKEPLRSAMEMSRDAESERRKSIKSLLWALAEKAMKSNCGVWTGIYSVIQYVEKDEYKYGDYLPLVQLILDDEPDSKVWRALLELLHSASLAKTQGISKRTRVNFCSAFLQCFDQNKEPLDYQLLEEIAPWTYRNVGGFIRKYFDGTTWAPSIQKIVDDMKYSEYKNGEWKAFAESTNEAEVWMWWQNFQACFSSEASGKYYHTKSRHELESGRSPHQLDIFVTPTNSAQPQHQWTKVMVIGELRQVNHDFEKTFVRLAMYVKEVFSAQPGRRFVHAFTLRDCIMEAWVFDRSGAYSSGHFNIHNEPEQFIKIIAGYCLMSEEELGLDTFMKQADDQCSIAFEERDEHGCFTNTSGGDSSSRTSAEELGHHAFEEPDDDGVSLAPRERDNANSPASVTMKVDPKVLFRQRAIVSRGTACYATKVPQGSRYDDCVTKVSWVPEQQESEAHFLKLVLERKVQGVVKLVAHCDLTSIKAFRSGLKFGKRYFVRGKKQAGQGYDSIEWKIRSMNSEYRASKRSRASINQANQSHDETTSITNQASGNETRKAQGPGVVDSDREHYENRVLRCLVLSPAGKPLYLYDSPLELVEAMRDAIKAHQSLYQKGKILHRDISENNIIITDANSNDGGFKGMLIDLDLAEQVVDGASGSDDQAGTLRFMAIETLRNKGHTYRHDLESFFYVLLWQCARRGWDYARRHATDASKQAEEEELAGPTDNVLNWHSGRLEQIASNKEGDLRRRFEMVFEQFPFCLQVVEELCRDFRQILFRMESDKDELFLGTPENSEELYSEVLGAFEKSIQEMRELG